MPWQRPSCSYGTSPRSRILQWPQKKKARRRRRRPVNNYIVEFDGTMALHGVAPLRVSFSVFPLNNRIYECAACVEEPGSQRNIHATYGNAPAAAFSKMQTLITNT